MERKCERERVLYPKQLISILESIEAAFKTYPFTWSPYSYSCTDGGLADCTS